MALTCSAKRSNPQRMSVASTASQIRVPCVRSSACKLGRPIMLPLPTPKATREDDAHRIRALPSGFGLGQAALQSLRCSLSMLANSSLQLAPLPRPQTSPLLVPAISSSTRRTGRSSDPAHCKMPLRSARSGSAPQPVPAASSTLPLCVASCLKSAAFRAPAQDGVQIALTRISEDTIRTMFFIFARTTARRTATSRN